MNKISFEWDDNKEIENRKKHNVSFVEAQSVFFDDDAIQYWDEDHSQDEERFLMLGMSNKLRLLLVVHYYREDEYTIRIISARKATNNEEKEYTGELA